MAYNVNFVFNYNVKLKCNDIFYFYKSYVKHFTLFPGRPCIIHVLV